MIFFLVIFTYSGNFDLLTFAKDMSSTLKEAKKSTFLEMDSFFPIVTVISFLMAQLEMAKISFGWVVFLSHLI